MSDQIRILQVVTHMDRGGLETMLMNYYRHIDRTKIQFDFLVHRTERAAYDDEIEVLGGKIYRLSRLIPWSRSYLNELNNFFAEHPEYRIVHVHQDCLSSVILKVAKKHDVPVRIAHSHNSSQEKNLKYPIKLWYRHSLSRYATHLFSCGKAAGGWMFCGAHYTVINNAIDPEPYRYNVEKGLEVRSKLGVQNKFVIGHVGRFNSQKNHSFIIDVFNAVLKYDTNSVLMLVGDGDGRAKIQIKAEQLGISDKVMFLGIRNDVADLMQAMDAFLFPSLYEGLPVTLIEAQASGLPCIISNSISSEVVVTDLVFSKKLTDTPNEWAKEILSHRNTVRTDRYSEIAAHEFDINTEAIKLQEFYLNAYECK